MASNEKPKVIKLLCDDGRERTSMEQFLRSVENMDDKRLESLFKMMPHEVADLKDTLRRSNI